MVLIRFSWTFWQKSIIINTNYFLNNIYKCLIFIFHYTKINKKLIIKPLIFFYKMSLEKYTIEIISCGPYLTSKYLQILEDCKINIKWERYYDKKTIDIGNYEIKKNSILDIKNKFSPDSRSPPRYLILNQNIINENNIGTSSDKYYINFDKPTKCNEKADYYIDR